MRKREAVYFLVNTSTVFEELFRLAKHLLSHDIEPIFHFTFAHWTAERDIQRCKDVGIQVVHGDQVDSSMRLPRLARVCDFFARRSPRRLAPFLSAFLTETIDLLASLARADKLLSATDARLLILSCDLVHYDSPAYVKAAHRQRKKVLIVSSIMSNGLDVAEVYYHNPKFHVVGLLDRLIAKVFPKWVLPHRERKLFRVPPHRILAMEMLGLAPPAPWLFNSSRADAVTMESEAMADYSAAAGMPRPQMRIVGSTADDILARALANKRLS
jgi:hypothetical protein